MPIGPKANAMGLANRMRTDPIPVQRTNRAQQQRVLTSLNAGQTVPLFAVPLLREDSVSGASYRVSFEMDETVEILMNAINVRVLAYCVSNLAMGRFESIDEIDKSYEGLPVIGGQPVKPWFNTIPAPAPGTNAILTKMGLHAKSGTPINTSYIEAYNAIYNFRAANRSPDLPLRGPLDMTLAPSFWDHQSFAHIVPDFDQAIIDGEVALNVVNSKMPVKGLGIASGATLGASAAAPAVWESGSDQPVNWAPAKAWQLHDATAAAGKAWPYIRETVPGGGGIDVWAELQDNGITVSLSNIEAARKTQAFANLRRQYSGHSDEYIIDLLMDGISIPEQQWKQPMLLADEATVFGMSKRYASDGANLTESVVNGLTFIDLGFSCPRVPMGGVILVVAEIAPEQLFERQKDPYLHAAGVNDLPQFLRDTLDPEKVSIVTNDFIDTSHATPSDTFGYAPLNHQWAKGMPRVGGRFYRPAADTTFDEDRQRIWAVETPNPVLSRDFYLVTTMHYKPFVVTATNKDHFECLVRGAANIRGNTVFGGVLVESTGDYAEVVEEIPFDRIDKPASLAADGEEVQS